MKINRKSALIRLTIVFLYCIIIPPCLMGAAPRSDSPYTVVNMLDQLHVQPAVRDENFYKSLKHDFIRNLDASGLHFTRKDVKNLESIPLNELDLKNLSRSHFFLKALSLFRVRINETRERISVILADGLDYNQKGKFERQTGDDTEYLDTPDELRSRWKRVLKFRVLNLAYLSSRHTKPSNPLKYLEDHRRDLEKTVKRLALEDIDEIRNPTGGFDHRVAVIFIKTIGWLYDSHTQYMTLNEIRDLEESLSRESTSFGIILKEELTGETRIARVIPSGPAWKSRRVDKDDILIAIRDPRNNRYYEITEAGHRQLGRLLSDRSARTLEFVLEKKDGQRIHIPLTKASLPSQSNIVDAFVLKGKEKVGYISLPAFYADLTGTGKGGCAEDVARALYYLKREKIAALILDLRGNGGGLVSEAVELAGLFIDEGPLFLNVNGSGESMVSKDPSRGTVYDGPLILMVDSASASASELLTGTLRDYNRAVVVGSRTFGKATQQNGYPVVRNSNELNQLMKSRTQPEESINISVQLMYNLEGDSHQGKGIQPDIKLPGPPPIFITTEDKMLHPLKVGPYERRVAHLKRKQLDIDDLRSESESRVEDHPGFEKLMELSSQLEKEFGPGSTFPMKAEDFFKDMDRKWKMLDNVDRGLQKSSGNFTVDNYPAQKELLNLDRDKKERNRQLTEQIEKDIYLDETYNIALDMIEQVEE